jgi:hypothetical protein
MIAKALGQLLGLLTPVEARVGGVLLGIEAALALRNHLPTCCFSGGVSIGDAIERMRPPRVGAWTVMEAWGDGGQSGAIAPGPFCIAAEAL